MWALNWVFENKDIIDFWISIIEYIVGFVLFPFLLFKNYHYYENIKFDFYQMNDKNEVKNIVEEYVLPGATSSTNKIVFIEPRVSPITIKLLEYKPTKFSKNRYTELTSNSSYLINPGKSFKLTYPESEGIPMYKLKICSRGGKAFVPLNYNGIFKYSNTDFILFKRKFFPFIINGLIK